MPTTPCINEIVYSGRFKKAYSRLDNTVQRKVDRALRDLLTEPIPSGRRLEKIKGYTGIWSTRIDLNYRLTFKLTAGIASLRNVATHTEAYQKP